VRDNRRAGPLRIVHFVYAFNGRTLADVAGVLGEQMDRRGCEVVLLAVKGSPETGRLPEGIPKVVLGDAGTWRATGALPRLRRTLRRLRPDVVFAHGNGPIRAAVLASRGLPGRPRIVGIEHNHYSSYPWNLRPVRDVVNRAVLPFADAIAGVSGGVVDDLERTFPALSGRVSLLPPPLTRYEDIGRLAAEPVDHAWFEGDIPVITTVGHVHPRKDHRTLVRAMARVRDVAGPEAARLVIVGAVSDHGEGAQVRALVAELGLEDQVALVGAQANPLRFVARSSVFALSSRNEGMPVSILEAMAVGVPVVSTDCPSGPAWILEGGERGLLVPVGDGTALGDALLRMLDDQALRDELGRWGVRRAADFSPAAIADRYLALAANGSLHQDDREDEAVMQRTVVGDVRVSPDGPVARRPRIAVWAYACSPDGGSDPGATWAYVRALLAHGDLTVFHVPDDAEPLRTWCETNPGAPLHLVEVAPPRWSSMLRRGYGLHRQLEFLTYLGWLRRAEAITRRQQRLEPFDILAHASYGNYWLPSPVWKLGVPSLWGPVGGGVRTPPRLWSVLGGAGLLAELERSIGLGVLSALPATRRTQRRVTVPIVETEDTRRRLPRHRRADALIANRVAIVDPELVPTGTGDVEHHPAEFLFTSALWGKKGPALAIEALHHADPRVRLTFVNDGYERARLERLAHQLGVEDRVAFLGRIPRDELFARMRAAAGLVFTGLREEGGMALAEAMASGLPVIVLDLGGAGLIARSARDPARVRLVEPGGRTRTARRLAEAMSSLLGDAPTERTSTLDTRPHLEEIRVAVTTALSVRAGRAYGPRP
jgi:glycosyltransferase involved in cell wall biosynthesis